MRTTTTYHDMYMDMDMDMDMYRTAYAPVVSAALEPLRLEHQQDKKFQKRAISPTTVCPRTVRSLIFQLYWNWRERGGS